jgi:hypothetical protein
VTRIFFALDTARTATRWQMPARPRRTRDSDSDGDSDNDSDGDSDGDLYCVPYT